MKLLIYTKWFNNKRYSSTGNFNPKPAMKVCGLRRRPFFILLYFIILFISFVICFIHSLFNQLFIYVGLIGYRKTSQWASDEY